MTNPQALVQQNWSGTERNYSLKPSYFLPTFKCWLSMSSRQHASLLACYIFYSKPSLYFFWCSTVLINVWFALLAGGNSCFVYIIIIEACNSRLITFHVLMASLVIPLRFKHLFLFSWYIVPLNVLILRYPSLPLWNFFISQEMIGLFLLEKYFYINLAEK